MPLLTCNNNISPYDLDKFECLPPCKTNVVLPSLCAFNCLQYLSVLFFLSSLLLVRVNCIFSQITITSSPLWTCAMQIGSIAPPVAMQLIVILFACPRVSDIHQQAFLWCGVSRFFKKYVVGIEMSVENLFKHKKLNTREGEGTHYSRWRLSLTSGFKDKEENRMCWIIKHLDSKHYFCFGLLQCNKRHGRL